MSVGESPAKGHTWTIPTTEAGVAGCSHPFCQSNRVTENDSTCDRKTIVFPSENTSRAPRTRKQSLAPFKDTPCTPLVTAFPLVSLAKGRTALACWMSEHLWMLQNPQWQLAQSWGAILCHGNFTKLQRNLLGSSRLLETGGFRRESGF